MPNTKPERGRKMNQLLKLAKYLDGTAKSLALLSQEIVARKGFDKDDEELLSQIGSNLLFHAKSFTFLP